MSATLIPGKEPERHQAAGIVLLLGAPIGVAGGCVIAGACVAAIAFAVYFVRLMRRMKPYREEPILTDRREVGATEVYSEYYAASDIPMTTVLECVQAIADAVEVPAGKVRPSDRFGVDYAPMPGDGVLALKWFIDDKRKTAGVRETRLVYTVDEFIRYVHELNERGRVAARSGTRPE